jgi:hypothetical protein
MPYTSIVLVLALHLSDGPGPDVVELRARAEARAKDRAYAEAGGSYEKLAALPGVDRRKELLNAHTNFEAAYLTSQETRHLCRALRIAEQVVREDGFENEQMGLFWRERVEEDLERLRVDAVKTKRPNCRFATTGESRPPVPLLADGDPPQVRINVPEQTELARDIAPPVPSRRFRAQTAAGAAFTGLGIGFLGLFAGALAVKADQVQAIHKQADLVQAQGRLPTPAEQAWVDDREADARQMHSLVIGVGVAGGASLATGVILLATRKRLSRRAALRPFGGAHGAGILLQGRF